MTYQKTTCIVLRHTPFQESSLIVSGISPDAGRLDFLLKGVRRYGKKNFPELGLFREFSLKYTPPERRSSMFAVRDLELITVSDSIAQYTENYFAACNIASFLLSVTHPMLEAVQTYRAFRTLLANYTVRNGVEPWQMLVKLAFLSENGLIPDPEHDNERELLLRLIAASQGEENPPVLDSSYQLSLICWIDGLLCRHGFRK